MNDPIWTPKEIADLILQQGIKVNQHIAKHINKEIKKGNKITPTTIENAVYDFLKESK